MGAGVHDAINPQEEGEDQNQRDEKDDLPGKGDQCARLALPMEVKKLAVMGWKALASVINR